jgi:methyl coenzyme M reductase system subunit A2
MHTQEVDYWNELDNGTRIGKNIYDRMSMMTQRQFSLYGELPVIENVMLALDDAGIPKHMQRPLAVKLLSQVKLTHRITHVARDLSGGEKQRVVFAMCIAKNPILILADEPTGTLDPITAQAVHEVIKNEINKGMSMVITSHWPEAVAELTSEAILLEKGKVTDQGNSQEVANKFLQKVKKIKKVRKVVDKPLIAFKGVKKYYYTFDRGLIRAVDNVEFEIHEGEIFGIVGVSGSGKTTISKMIAGHVMPSHGLLRIRSDGQWVDMRMVGPEGKGMVTPNIAILYQEYTLSPLKNIYENLEGALKTELPAELVAMKVNEVLQAVGFTDEEIDKILYMLPEQLSEGERHRIAIARVLMNDPKVVILDEPTGTADPITRAEIAEYIRYARDRLGQTYIIVSHDMDFIDMVCDRALLMRTGKIVEIGDPTKVVETMREVETAMG